MITYEKTIIGVIGVHLHNNPNSDRHKIEFTTKELNCITEHMKNDIDLQVEHEALKKPPTVDDVCLELSKHYKEQVSYSNETHKHLFYFEKSKLSIVLLRYGNIYFYQNDYHRTNYLPPHLVTLIGRFYEGLGK